MSFSDYNEAHQETDTYKFFVNQNRKLPQTSPWQEDNENDEPQVVSPKMSPVTSPIFSSVAQRMQVTSPKQQPRPIHSNNQTTSALIGVAKLMQKTSLSLQKEVSNSNKKNQILIAYLQKKQSHENEKLLKGVLGGLQLISDQLKGNNAQPQQHKQPFGISASQTESTRMDKTAFPPAVADVFPNPDYNNSGSGDVVDECETVLNDFFETSGFTGDPDDPQGVDAKVKSRRLFVSDKRKLGTNETPFGFTVGLQYPIHNVVNLRIIQVDVRWKPNSSEFIRNAFLWLPDFDQAELTSDGTEYHAYFPLQQQSGNSELVCFSHQFGDNYITDFNNHDNLLDRLQIHVLKENEDGKITPLTELLNFSVELEINYIDTTNEINDTNEQIPIPFGT